MKKCKILLLILWIIISIQKHGIAQSDNWQIPLSIEIEAKQFHLIFGVNQYATEGFDVGIDSLAPPASFTPYACFWISDFPNTLTRDFRRPDSLIVWKLKIFNAEGKKVKLNWQVDSLHSTGTIVLNDSIIFFQRDSCIFWGNQEIKIIYRKNISEVCFRRIQNNAKDYRIISYPNPFSSAINFEIQSARNGPITVSIYNVLGQRIKQFFFSEGQRTVFFQWNGLNQNGISAPAGRYFLQVQVAAHSSFIKPFVKIE